MCKCTCECPDTTCHVTSPKKKPPAKNSAIVTLWQKIHETRDALKAASRALGKHQWVWWPSMSRAGELLPRCDDPTLQVMFALLLLPAQTTCIDLKHICQHVKSIVEKSHRKRLATGSSVHLFENSGKFWARTSLHVIFEDFRDSS